MDHHETVVADEAFTPRGLPDRRPARLLIVHKGGLSGKNREGEIFPAGTTPGVGCRCFCTNAAELWPGGLGSEWSGQWKGRTQIKVSGRFSATVVQRRRQATLPGRYQHRGSRQDYSR